MFKVKKESHNYNTKIIFRTDKTLKNLFVL